MNRLVVIGLDGLAPQLALDTWLEELPNLKALLSRGFGGRLRSTIPAITVPAWTSMMTSKDPGALGIYGFRNRRSRQYHDFRISDAAAVHAATVWDHLSRNGRRSLVMGVPQTYPPRPINGILISCFMTPDKKAQFTYPAAVQPALDKLAGGEYVIDVENFRTDNKLDLLTSIQQMTLSRFRAFRALLKADNFDFAMMVEMGPDRLHHGFWRYCDPRHRLYQPGNPYEQVLHDYYLSLDEEIGRVTEAAGDGASFLVVSDHGAKAMEGAICINEWLQDRGYLTLKERPSARTSFRPELVDWRHTLAWGEGGYYGRLFLNVAGREPEGRLSPREYEAFRTRLKSELEAIGDEAGRPIGTRVFRPEDIYSQVNGIAPDLIVYFGDLDWRSAGLVGVRSWHLRENDTGPDDANHSEDGIVVWDPGPAWKPRIAASYLIYDLAPSILRFFGLTPPEDMLGSSIL
jgi:predicted AlkP superfamily phosphohydrolase/phosphomutase